MAQSKFRTHNPAPSKSVINQPNTCVTLDDTAEDPGTKNNNQKPIPNSGTVYCAERVVRTSFLINRCGSK